jgi:hypothetical protein
MFRESIFPNSTDRTPIGSVREFFKSVSDRFRDRV